MRPQSIIRFERVVLAMVVVGLLATVLNWENMTAAVAELGYGEGLVAATQALSVGILLLLMWLIARRRSVVAKWIYVLLSLGGLIMAAIGISDMLRQSTPLLIIEVVQWLLTIFSVWLLFRPDSNSWFSGRSGDTAA